MSKPTKKASSEGVQAWYTHCPVFNAGNVDAELGWIEDEFKKLGAKFSYFRSVRENDWWPHYRHNLNNFFRSGGCAPAIHVMADIRRTKLIGLHWLYEGGGMIARVDSDIYTMKDLKGKKIGMSKSLNKRKNDWWRVTEERGIEMMLKVNGMTREDVTIVDFPYEDDWYSDPRMLEPLKRPADLWLKRDIHNDMAFRPAEPFLEKGKCDAIYTADCMWPVQQATGKFKMIENLSSYSDWTLQVANAPYTITVDVEFAEEHPDLIVAYMRGTIRVARWMNANKRAAATLLHRSTFYMTEELTAKAMEPIDFMPYLSPMNLKAIEIEKDFMLSHGYIKNDFKVSDWVAPEFLEEALKSL
jgi:ABC-type nitrate/sulfonate/bicarbonate transport system substrate-binding protein